MNDYQKEQLDALAVTQAGLARLGDAGCRDLLTGMAPYVTFRKVVDDFLLSHFRDICTQTCFESHTSACCAKDSIIVFFADMVVNAVHSRPDALNRLERVLKRENTGHRCVYLSPDGCVWTIRPVVCARFLCDRAMDAVFSLSPEAKTRWNDLCRQEKDFRWPDKPVLFDDLEKTFLAMGLRSSLMHLNFSPGLVRVRQRAGLIP